MSLPEMLQGVVEETATALLQECAGEFKNDAGLIDPALLFHGVLKRLDEITAAFVRAEIETQSVEAREVVDGLVAGWESDSHDTEYDPGYFGAMYAATH